MAFPDDILTDDESVVEHVHPHWRELVRPVLVLALGLVAVAVAWLWWPASDYRQTTLYVITGVVALLVAWLSLWPWLVWRTTHYVFTTERVVWQFGIFHRERRDIPLHRVNNHLMRQSLVDRLFGCGTLVIESAGETGQTELVDVPGVQRVQTLLYDLVDADRDRHSLGDGEFREIMREMRDQRD